MKITRQQRRLLQRRMAKKGITTEQAERFILAYREAGEAKREEARRLAPGVVDEAVIKIQRDIEPQIRKRVRDETIMELLTIVVAYEHIDKGHTGKYLTKWMAGFMDFCNAVGDEGSGIEGLRKILLDECNITVEEIMSRGQGA